VITLAGPHSISEEIKRSRFIARAAPLRSAEEASALVAELSDPDATHNCWAWRVGEAYRSSDDGEPGGTAGRPILSAIDKQGIDGALVVVTRFYGGIKLGAGGLVRAYGGAAARCLREAAKVEVHPTVRVTTRVPFDATGVLYGLLDGLETTDREERWSEQGLVIVATVRVADLDRFRSALADATRGQGRIEVGQAP